MYEEGAEGKKTAHHSETFSPVSSLRLNTNGRLAPVVKVEAEGLLWLSIASCVRMECGITYTATVDKIIKSIITWLLNVVYRLPA